jgi:transcriptional activator SPT7
VTAEYMMNLGRTLKFYADRQGDKMSSEVGIFFHDSSLRLLTLCIGLQEILLHVLKENGIPSPNTLRDFVDEDIDRYGAGLTSLKAKLQNSREDQLDQVSPEAMTEEILFDNDGEALAR